ncbi:putative mitochondrial protein, conserved [Mycoblastus sanguinarius]|nr:putative mitochondrial protein, conserved [Mycoblastus sanguinarius]
MQRSNLRILRSQTSRRLLSFSSKVRAAPPFASGPAPPRLPKEDQELYEKLQRSSTGAFSAPKPTVVVNQSPASTSDAHTRSKPQINQLPHTEADSILSTEQNHRNIDARVEAKGDGEELHPDVRRGTKPEFEGERNPKTGETGGPKNEPLRWGGGVDWSYNGRVTDF